MVPVVSTHTPSTKTQADESDISPIAQKTEAFHSLNALPWLLDSCDIRFTTNNVAWRRFAQLLSSASAAGKPLLEQVRSYGFLSLATLGKSWMVVASNATFGLKVSVFKPYCPRTPQTSPFWGAGVVAPYRGDCTLSVFQQSGRRRVARYVCRNDDGF